jgi:hypothetical protein
MKALKLLLVCSILFWSAMDHKAQPLKGPQIEQKPVGGQKRTGGELIGYWKLRGDTRDYSGNNNHGVNHGADLAAPGPNGKPSALSKLSMAS